MSKLDKFNADDSKRLSKEEGNNVINNGILLGESKPQKGTYWSVYKFNKEFFITLCDMATDVWLVSEEDAIRYNEIPIRQ